MFVSFRYRKRYVAAAPSTQFFDRKWHWHASWKIDSKVILSATNSTRFFKVTYISDQLSRLKWPSFLGDQFVGDQSRVTLKKPSAPKNNVTSRARASYFFLIFFRDYWAWCYIWCHVVFSKIYLKTVFASPMNEIHEGHFESNPSLKYDSIILGYTSLC